MKYFYDGQNQQTLFQEKHQGVFDLKESDILDVFSDIVCTSMFQSYRMELMKVLDDVDNPDFLLVYSTNSYELFGLSTLATESKEDSYSAEVPELIFTTDKNFDESKFIRMDVNEKNLEDAKLRLRNNSIFNEEDIYLIKQDCVEDGSKVSYVIVYIPDSCLKD